MINSIDHLGIAVDDLENNLRLYRDLLGAEYAGEEVVKDQGVKVAILKIGGVKIELLQPLSDNSPIARFLAKGGRGIHHIAYRVDDLEAALKRCADNGLKLIDKTPRRGAGGARIAFLHPKSTGGVLTELISKGRE